VFLMICPGTTASNCRLFPTFDLSPERTSAATRQHAPHRGHGERCRKAGSTHDCPASNATRIRGCPAADKAELGHRGEEPRVRPREKLECRAVRPGLQNHWLHQGLRAKPLRSRIGAAHAVWPKRRRSCLKNLPGRFSSLFSSNVFLAGCALSSFELVASKEAGG